MFEFESQFGTVILECACAVCVMCAVLVVSHWWYLIGGMDRMVYLFGGISLVVYLIGGISLVVSHYRVLPGTTRGRGRGVGGGLCPCLQLSVMYAFVNMFIPARRLNKNVRRAHILEHTLLWRSRRRACAVPSTLSFVQLLICLYLLGGAPECAERTLVCTHVHIRIHIQTYTYISTTCRHVYMPCRSRDIDFDSIVYSNEELKGVSLRPFSTNNSH